MTFAGQNINERPCYWCGSNTKLDMEKEITWYWVTKTPTLPKPVYTPYAFCHACSDELFEIIENRRERK